MSVLRLSIRGRTVPLLIALCALNEALAIEHDTASIDFFEREVRPVLVQRCLECHGSETQENDLRVDSRAAILQGGSSGPAIVAGNIEQSRLIQAIRYDGELQMPPVGPLPAKVVTVLEKWVGMGAPFPAAITPTIPKGSASERSERQATTHWAYQPLKKPTVPLHREEDWTRNEVDRFVLEKMKEHRLAPSPEADRATLIRRLYFDLIGLPPTAEEVESFASDASETAYEALVDDLLKRPQYGQRWARHWLDVARYADTTGYIEGGQRRYPFAWTYRDYVVRSFNEDTPYNRFVLEQLAADQLELPPEQEWKLAAMGFLTVGPRFNYVRHDIIDDRIDVVTRGLLGLTVTCARCHDHKYDAILTDDYYGLYGMFASSEEPVYADLPRTSASRGDFRRYRKFRSSVAKATRAFERFHVRVHKQVQHEMRATVADYLRYLVQLMPDHRSVVQPSFETRRGRLRGPTPYGPGAIVRWQHYIDRKGENDPVFGLWNRLAAIDSKDWSSQSASLIKATPQTNTIVRDTLLDAQPSSMLEVASIYGELLEKSYEMWQAQQSDDAESIGLADADWEQLRGVLYADDSPVTMNAEEAHDCYTDGEFGQYVGLKRELDSLFVEFQDVAAPRAMILTDREVPQEPRVFARGVATRPGDFVSRRFLRVLSLVDNGQPFQNGSGRLEFARAVADPANPLTARVIVNRFWQWHFGRGLVSTPSDFGTRADAPSHPQLLDYLAADLIENGWSLKRLHKQLVMSAAYRQSSRASAESFQMDPENQWLSRMIRRRLDFEPLRDSMLAVSGRLDQSLGGPPAEAIDSKRRSLYVLVNRDDLPSVFATFDFPSPDLSVATRTNTTVPQQALFLMNSSFADLTVKRIVRQLRLATLTSSDRDRVTWLYRRVLGRSPDAQETAIAIQFLGSSDNAAGERRGANLWYDLVHTLLMSNEFQFVD